MSFKEAKSPAGPEPITIIFLLSVTGFNFIRGCVSLGDSLIKAFTRILNTGSLLLASIDRLTGIAALRSLIEILIRLQFFHKVLLY